MTRKRRTCLPRCSQENYLVMANNSLQPHPFCTAACMTLVETDQGIKNIGADKAAILAGSDPDYAIKDLYEAIATGNYVSH